MKLDMITAPSNLLCPGCGYEGEHRSQSAVHKRSCKVLRQRVIDEIKRLATELGRSPATADWAKLANPALPAITWLFANLGGWKQLLNEAGLTPSDPWLTAQPQADDDDDDASSSAPVAPVRYYWQREEEALKEYGYHV